MEKQEQGVELFSEDFTETISQEEAKSSKLPQHYEVMIDDNYVEYLAQQEELKKNQAQ
ncbi:MAG: hypothetical protein J6C08_01915 [Campylobacter sp.]|uniref:hypothetical protein n=1 Tax=Campylobacter sp. TaxID=205 RepID=UPI001AFDC92D|nr:hypothetical protein [Campylobacter sp.]MBO5063251.1 hypothetical protein [Campylobacter sp.]MBQ8608753.1 hypothetical protein [Campylobacter sp.]